MPLLTKDIMKTDVLVVSPSMSLAELQRTLLEARVSGAPVVEKGELVGLISRSDIVKQFSVGHSLADYIIHDDYSIMGPLGAETSTDERRRQTEQMLGERLGGVTVRQAMATHVVSVSPTTSLRDTAKLMHQERIHRLLVTEGRRLVGLVTTLDLVGLIAEGTFSER